MHNNNRITSSSDHHRHENGREVVRRASLQYNSTPRNCNSQNGLEELFSAPRSTIWFSHEDTHHNCDNAVDIKDKATGSNDIRNSSNGFAPIGTEQRTLLSGQAMSEIKFRSNS